MTKPALAILATLLVGGGLGFAASAQQNDRQLIIYGNDRCPEGTICVRAPESERYRIPQTLRSEPLDTKNQPWAARGASVARAGASSGAGSCSATGAGGFTGCLNQELKAARDERRQQNAATAASVAPQPE